MSHVRSFLLAATAMAALFACLDLRGRYNPSEVWRRRLQTASSASSASGANLTSRDGEQTRAASAKRGSSGIQCGIVEENFDYRGGDFKSLPGVESVDACGVACNSEPWCKSYTFAKASGWCYLKRVAKPGRTRSACCVSGLRPCPPGVTPAPLPPAIQCGTVEDNVDYRGGDFKSLPGVKSAEACGLACNAEPLCKSFTFAKASGWCFLKRVSKPGRARSKCCVSGLRPCPPGVTPAPPPPPPPVHDYSNVSNRSIRGVAYGPLPCTSGCWVSEDMLQEGYQALWGPSPGRDDLGVIRNLGGNTVRLYHSIGLDGQGNHGLFLDRAEDLGLDVMPGYHTYNAIYGGCPHFDCYEAWKSYTLKAFKTGFRRGNGWHPAVSVLLLFNELDFFRAHGPTAHARSAVSALDGVLAAEREAGVEPGRVRLSIAWSNAPGKSLDGQVSGFAVWAFHDVAYAISNPEELQYSPRTPKAEMENAFRTRWAHSINVQTPGIVDYMAEHYQRFEPIPWFIGEYGANGLSHEAIKDELLSMDRIALDKTNPFMGMAFFQFQAAYFKGGSEMNFGLFRLGDKRIAETGDICDKGVACKKWPVHCLTTSHGWLPEFVQGRAEAVAAAWEGQISTSHMC